MARSDITRAKPLERVLALSILIFASGVFYAAFAPIVDGDFAGRAGDSLLYKGLWLGLYGSLAISVAIRFEMMISTILTSGLVALLLLVYFTSEVLNAGIEGATTRITLLFLTIIYTAWLSRLFSLTEIVNMFLYTFVIVIVAHIAILVVFGSPYNADVLNRTTLLGVSAKSGLFPHKNDAGITFCLATVFFTARYFYSSNKRWPFAVCAGISAILLLLAGASGSVVAAIAGLGVIVSLLVLNKLWGFVLSGFIVLVFLPLAFIDDDSVLGFFGRGTDLTGRTTIWSWWPFFFSENPWIGLGYSGFFNPGGPAFRLWQVLPYQYQAVNFHNSFLDVGIQTGIFGLSLVVLIFVSGLWRAGIMALKPRRKYAVIPLALMVPLTLFAAIEFAIPAHNNFATVVFFIMYFKTAQLYRKDYVASRYSVFKRLRYLNLIKAQQKPVGQGITVEHG